MQRVQLRTPAAALWRSAGVLQIGLDSPAVVLDGVPAQLREAVALLARPRTVAEIGTLVPKLEARWVSWLLIRLSDAGLLVETAPVPPQRVTVVGSGPLATAVQAALDSGGVLVELLENTAFVASRFDQPDGREAALTVLAAPHSEPDRSLTDALFRAGRPHLIVRLEADRAVVGPLVVPGRTPCVRCLDLSRCRLDPSWPRLLAQLCLDQVGIDASLLVWAAATSMVQVRSWLNGRMPESAGSSLELALPDYQLATRQWAAHPRCGCLLPIG